MYLVHLASFLFHTTTIAESKHPLSPWPLFIFHRLKKIATSSLPGWAYPPMTVSSLPSSL